jgi:hypothetical protein
LPEPGDFGAYLAKGPRAIIVDGKTLPAHAYTYSQRLLRIPKESFEKQLADHEVELALAE